MVGRWWGVGLAYRTVLVLCCTVLYSWEGRGGEVGAGELEAEELNTSPPHVVERTQFTVVSLATETQPHDPRVFAPQMRGDLYRTVLCQYRHSYHTILCRKVLGQNQI